MFNMLHGLFSKQADKNLKDRVAEILKTDPAKLEAFEQAYKENVLMDDAHEPDNFFDMNSRQASAIARENGMQELPDDEIAAIAEYADHVCHEAARELIAKTDVIGVSSDGMAVRVAMPALPDRTAMLSNQDLAGIPKALRPQATGNLMHVDFRGEMSCVAVLENYKTSVEATDPKRRQQAYHMFRQGLDVLDLDPVTYAMLGMNRNSMGYWLPPVAAAAAKHGFFRIPETRIAKVPINILQLSRMDYSLLTRATLDLVDEWAMEAFALDPKKTYFIKTGTYSSKFDFRNAKVTGEKEVRELGEYLLFIQHQAAMMAGPLSQPSIYGVSTTNEWVVREFIEDKEKNPCIYKGLPLHTEYRIFVDFDTDEILGINPYWDPDVMKARFSEQNDAASPHQRHDYVIYKMHEDVLMSRYRENKDKVLAEIAKMIPDVGLEGQWSVDIMQNGDEFWLIDMATADTSALNHCIPAGKLRKSVEDWIPELPAAN